MKRKKNNYIKYLISIVTILAIVLTIQRMGIGQLEASSRTELDQWIEQLKKDSVFQRLDHLVVKENTQQYSLTSKHTMLTFPMTIQYKTYMILTTDSSNEERILEYGIGTYLPYQKEVVINLDLRQLTPKRFQYLSPVESYWEYQMDDQSVFIEGSTGEWLPELDEGKLSLVSSDKITYHDTLSKSVTNKGLSFNVTDNLSWLTNNTMDSLSANEIQNQMDQNKKLIFVGSKYDHSVRFAYPIVGYHIWNSDQLFLGVFDEELDLIRYISFEDLTKYGQVMLAN